MISVYLQGVLDSTEDEEIIIGAFKDEELNVATASWLEARGRSGEYSYIWQTGTFEDKIYLQQAPQQVCNWENASIVLCYPNQMEAVMALMGGAEGVDSAQYGNYCMIKKVK